MAKHNLNRVTLGLFLGFSAFALFSLSDASAKFIKGALPPFETAFFGAVFGLVILPFLQRRGDRWTAVFETPKRALWLLRFFAYPVGVMGSVTAFTHLSMAEAFVLMFLQPTYVTVISVLFLKEQVDLHRWAAVALGLLGVVIALHPGFRQLSLGHLGAVLAGLGGAISVVTFRAADPAEKKVSLFGAGILGGITVCFVAMLPYYRTPTNEELLLLASYGLLAAFANLVLMRATELAPAAWIGPTQYSQMIWAIILGSLIFGDHIDTPTLIGVMLIIGSGILTLHRERVRKTPLPPAIAASTPHVGAALLPENGGKTATGESTVKIVQPDTNKKGIGNDHKDCSPITLNDGKTLPAIGFGTYNLNGAAGVETIVSAICNGYRLIDSAFNYENEGALGAALREAGVPRAELRVTSKLPGRHHRFDEAIATIEESLYRAQFDYYDLYLIHWPNPAQGLYVEAWRALIEARKRGLVRSIGVSNFLPAHIERIISETGVVPAVNQIELHPYFPQAEQLAFDKAHGIVTESWSPLGRARHILQNPVIEAIANRHSRGAGQVILHWHHQLGALPIPKSASPERQVENLSIFDFELSDDDMSSIATLARSDGRIADQDPARYEEF